MKTINRVHDMIEMQMDIAQLSARIHRYLRFQGIPVDLVQILPEWEGETYCEYVHLFFKGIGDIRLDDSVCGTLVATIIGVCDFDEDEDENREKLAEWKEKLSEDEQSDNSPTM